MRNLSRRAGRMPFAVCGQSACASRSASANASSSPHITPSTFVSDGRESVRAASSPGLGIAKTVCPSSSSITASPFRMSSRLIMSTSAPHSSTAASTSSRSCVGSTYRIRPVEARRGVCVRPDNCCDPTTGAAVRSGEQMNADVGVNGANSPKASRYGTVRERRPVCAGAMIDIAPGAAQISANSGLSQGWQNSVYSCNV